MKHKDYKELLTLSFYDELNDQEQRVLDDHIQTCDGCRQEREEMHQFRSLLGRSRQFEITEQLLEEARRELRVALRLEKSKRPFWAGLMEQLEDLTSPPVRFALSGVAILLVGIATGYMFLRSSEMSTMSGVMQLAGQSSAQSPAPRVTNFKFVGQPVEGGDVEFTFDLVAPVRMKGNVNDAEVQRVMAQALIGDQNPGSRLRTVNAIAEQGESLKSSDTEIKSALLQAVKADPNVGVRKQALEALRRFPVDKEIRDALLFVLQNEGNPAIRIAAIAHLQSPELSQQLVDKDLLDVLKERMNSDKNNYVRTRAKHFYEEVQPQ